MNKKSIQKALQKTAGGTEFVTQGDIKRCIGCGNDRAVEVTRGLFFIRFNRTKFYDAEDVAEKLCTFMEVEA
jgi:hypothetical protein